GTDRSTRARPVRAERRPISISPRAWTPDMFRPRRRPEPVRCGREAWYSDHMEVGVRELKAKLSEYLSRVERGETLDVTSRGRCVARIVPATRETTLERGLREGWLTREVDRPFEPFA